jgi:hypothetical protein
MKTIYKYPVSSKHSEVTIPMHWGSQILKFDVQQDKIVMWALVDTTRPKHNRIFYLVETGEEIITKHLHSMQYYGSVLLHGDEYVLHIFEIIR